MFYTFAFVVQRAEHVSDQGSVVFVFEKYRGLFVLVQLGPVLGTNMLQKTKIIRKERDEFQNGEYIVSPFSRVVSFYVAIFGI